MDENLRVYAERLQEMSEDLRLSSVGLAEIADELVALLDAGEHPWRAPVGTEEFPPEAWYVSVVHDPTGVANGGYAHTGIDINLDRWPWGDVERGAPVWACADGRVLGRGYSSGWLGVVLIEVEHHGMDLTVRYAHLGEDDIAVRVGDQVEAGQLIGRLGDWRGGDGGDHLHFDMAWGYMEWNWWLTKTVAWIDPALVLEEHLGSALVARMMGRNDG